MSAPTPQNNKMVDLHIPNFTSHRIIFSLVFSIFLSLAHAGSEKTFHSPHFGYEFTHPSDVTVDDMSNQMPAGFFVFISSGSNRLQTQIMFFERSDITKKGFLKVASELATESRVSTCGETPTVENVASFPIASGEAAKVTVLSSVCSDGPDTEYTEGLPKTPDVLYVINLNKTNKQGKAEALLFPVETMSATLVERMVQSIKVFIDTQSK